MKLILLLTLLINTITQARPITFEWDKLPNVKGYIIQTKENNQWIDKGTSLTNQFSSDFTDDVFEIRIASYNETSGSEIVSKVLGVFSEAMTIPKIPESPKTLRIKMVFELQSSTDMKNFEEIATISFAQPALSKEFFRLAEKN